VYFDGNKTMAITAIYARCSSLSQDLRSQESDLKVWATQQEATGVEIRWFTDRATGTNFNRPGWQALEADVNAGLVDRIVVWRLDRLGRTAGKTIMLLDHLERKGVAFVSLRDGFDPSTPAGRLMRNLLVSFSQYETEVRSERQRAGIDAALEDVRAGKRKSWGGRKAGTRISLTAEKERLCWSLKESGQTVTSIARTLQLSRKTVYQALRRQPTP
jgi:DNA invertase Pin-like site-specific DNA recombinase